MREPSSFNKYRLAIDFDGTIYKHEFPGIGEPLPHSIESIKALKRAGFDLILWTCRTKEYLKKAKEKLKKDGVEFDAYNENLEFDIKSFADSRKVGADYYIDDKSLFVDKIDWINILELLELKTGINVFKYKDS